MIINLIDNTISNGVFISLRSLVITNINNISRTITIVQEPQTFSGSNINSKITISQSSPQTIPIQS